MVQPVCAWTERHCPKIAARPLPKLVSCWQEHLLLSRTFYARLMRVILLTEPCTLSWTAYASSRVVLPSSLLIETRHSGQKPLACVTILVIVGQALASTSGFPVCC